MSSIFRFKQFEILQEQSALKVGTDAMLLGALIKAKEASLGLDLGSGTGVLSLMIAQQNNSILIDAIEEHLPSYNECKTNFQNSPWKHRLEIYPENYFSFSFQRKYDLIFSNPPFYFEKERHTKTNNLTSKHTTKEDFDRFASLVISQLSSEGRFWVIVPFNIYKYIVDLNVFKNLFINNLVFIKAKINKSISRVVMCFSFHEIFVDKTELILRDSEGLYTDDYIDLTRDFHYNNLKDNGT